MIRFDNLPPEVVQAMCTPMHQILPPAPLPTQPHSHPHPTSSSPYAPYPSSGSSGQLQQLSGGLYLGSLSAVNDFPLLRAHGITHLVQALEAPWAPPCRKEDGFVAYNIDIRDKESTDLRPHLEAACQYIERALRRGEGVLVHCQQGVSRSPSIVIAYLIRNHAMSYDAALSFVKRKRACAKPNPGFARALMEWEQAWRRPQAQRRFTS
ncbi:protein-tyrosine phosphatase-like protein [Roridomyces roridus]|uniref:protein-tyrosine-phosphatase n=1 Tax=Roridomyces roridus TaxID=1738132 RepID=A0AAD7BDH3_9AGAR|nr:protein-tyrosine phosphatase-like protein [Roridomyces roridus]